jgi:N-ATPase, AtpR subunit
MSGPGFSPVVAALWAAAGGGFGLAYFAMLRRTAEILGAARGRATAVALTLGRLAAAIGFLALAAHFGTVPLLAAFLGFLAARARALRALRKAA